VTKGIRALEIYSSAGVPVRQDQTVEELPVTFQAAMIASDGWVIASDTRSTLQGGNWKRQTYETDKLVCGNRLVSAVFGDECAMVARERILSELKPSPESLLDSAFRSKMERLTEKIWTKERQTQSGLRRDTILSPMRIRGILFLAVGQKGIWLLGIGKQSLFSNSTNKYIAGDPTNPAVFLAERYYDKQRTVNELAFLAAHVVTESRRFNTMIDGLRIVGWRENTDDLVEFDEAQYERRSRELDSGMAALMFSAMK
jgi:hypothetical protein